MNLRRSLQPEARSTHRTVRNHAPLKSVSSRIILCVFFSTLLTAILVSWLSIGAIYRDVHLRTTHHAQQILEPRAAEFSAWYAKATAELVSASSIDTPWHARLIRALEVERSVSGPQARLRWTSEDLDARIGSGSSAPLPPPPAQVARHFDRLSLGPANSEPFRRGSDTPADTPDCIRTGVEFFQKSAPVLGSLEGCLSQNRVLGLLHPESYDLQGMRALLVDPDGIVRATVGIRSDARRGARVPLDRLYAARQDTLVEYTDPAGTPLVGALARAGNSGWSLVAETERSIAFAPAIAITNQILVVDICIILLFSVLAYKITRAIMAPIDALSEGAQRIAAGHVDYQIPAPAHDDDELGVLVGAFNEMMRKLRSSQNEIEQDRFRLAEKNEELQRANEILSQLSITDGLTKLHNHRYFQDNLTREIKRVSRTRQPLSLILLDIDDFKQLNDTHGHSAGDEVLVSLASIMNDSARESDLIARYGGEEFVILMPNTDLAGAVHLAEKLRMSVESMRLIIGSNLRPVNITISLGVALYNGDRRAFFIEADKALYQAKAAGKNCVIIAGSDSSGAA